MKVKAIKLLLDYCIARLQINTKSGLELSLLMESLERLFSIDLTEDDSIMIFKFYYEGDVKC